VCANYTLTFAGNRDKYRLPTPVQACVGISWNTSQREGEHVMQSTSANWRNHP